MNYLRLIESMRFVMTPGKQAKGSAFEQRGEEARASMTSARARSVLRWSSYFPRV